MLIVSSYLTYKVVLMQKIHSIDSLMKELGNRLTQVRIVQSKTQSQVAEQAGIGKRTLERLEAGQSIQLDNFLRVLQELKLLDALDASIPEISPRPMELLKLYGKPRQRASNVHAEEVAEKPWVWGDDE
ncbi:helix-turn-helix domain-containing protein [Treponema sp.]